MNVQSRAKAIELNPNGIGYYIQRGIAHYVGGNLEQSLADFEKVNEIESDNATGYNNRGVVLLTMNRYEDALESLNKANELNPNQNHTIADIAITHHALGNIEEGQILWQQLLEQDEQYKDADWVGKELLWHESLIEEARKLITGLGLE